MKRTIFFSLFIGYTILVYPQSWKPLNVSEKYNYHSGGDYPTIWTDSVKLINNDSVYYLNKILKFIKNTGSNYATESHYLNNQSQFFLSELIYSNDGDVVFYENDSTNYLVKTSALINDIWIFDSTDNLTAQIIRMDTFTIFSRVDSFKLILLSNEDTILLTKDHGIVRFPLLGKNNQYAELIGLETNHEGTSVPRVKDIFSYTAGDIFCYSSSYDNGIWRTTTLTKTHITDKKVNGDSIIFKTLSSSASTTTVNDQISTNYQKDVVNTIVYLDIAASPLNKFDHQFSGKIDSAAPISVGYNVQFSCLTKDISHNYQCKAPDSDTLVSCMLCDSYDEIYGVNVGLISVYKLECNCGRGFCTTLENLVGCIINGKQYGSVYNDSLFTPISDHLADKLPVRLYPNPCSSQLVVQQSLSLKFTNYNIYTINGQLIMQGNLQENKSILNLQKLQRGVYCIELISNNSIQVMRFVKE